MYIESENIITEKQFSSLSEEEAGIMDEIKDTTQEVYDIIKEKIKSIDVVDEKYNNYTFTSFKIEFYFFGSKVSCSVDCYNYFIKEYYTYSNLDLDEWSLYLGKHFSLMGLVVPCIKGVIVEPDVKNTIQHELESLCGQIMLERILNDYEDYVQIKTNIISDNELVSKTAELIYECIKTEKKNYMNGLYAYLMSLPKMVSFDVLKTSPTWKSYVKMVKTFNLFKDNPLFIEELKKYKTTRKKIAKVIDHFIRKIARVYNKVVIDKMEKQGWGR